VQKRTKKMGRPTKKVPRTLARLEEALTKGLPRWAACAYAKISQQCFYEWMHQPAFESQVLEWEAAAMNQMVAAVRKEPRGNQFLLARRFRQDYGDEVKIEHSGAVLVEYTNNWRSTGEAADAPPWTADSTSTGAPVQLVGGGETLAEDDPVPVDSD
jgi:hypothetical protein